MAVLNNTGRSPFTVLFGHSGYNNYVARLGIDYIENDEVSDEITLIQDETENKQCVNVATKALNTYDNTKYLERMNKKNVHHSIYNFEIGDAVIVKKDFDNNSQTKRKKFE